MTTIVVAVVPARNEAARIEATVRALSTVPAISQIIVVDDASTDDTAERAEAAGALVCRLSRREGKGGALAAGIARTDATVLLLIDGDLGQSAAGAGVLLTPVVNGEADMTIATPPRSRPSGFGLVERFARAGISKLGGVSMDRPLSGQRALRREIVARFGLAPRFGVEVGLTIDALRAGYRVLEVPMEVEHTRTARDLSGFAHRAKQGVDILRALGDRGLRRSKLDP